MKTFYKYEHLIFIAIVVTLVTVIYFTTKEPEQPKVTFNGTIEPFQMWQQRTGDSGEQVMILFVKDDSVGIYDASENADEYALVMEKGEFLGRYKLIRK